MRLVIKKAIRDKVLKTAGPVLIEVFFGGDFIWNGRYDDVRKD